MKTRICKQCGETKPLDRFRKYYGGRKGHYTICLDCEKVNSRAKYILGKEVRSKQEQEELDKIFRLYSLQKDIGLEPPSINGQKTVRTAEVVDNMISKYTERVQVLKDIKEQHSIPDIPHTIGYWLVTELVETPEYYHDTVYEDLLREFRPVLRIDTVSMMPVYDEQYKEVLDKLLRRFDEYEDTYYNKDKGGQ